MRKLLPLAILFLLLVSDCDPKAAEQWAKIGAEIQNQQLKLLTSTGTSQILPSQVYCGNEHKGLPPHSGGCAGKATDENGGIAAQEQVEIRGWLVDEVHFCDPAEVGFSVLLDYGWEQKTDPQKVFAINTPERIVNALTPADIIVFGRNPARISAASSRLQADPNLHAWGGRNATVIHIEAMGWRRESEQQAPADWNAFTDGDGHAWAFNPFRPAAFPERQKDLGSGDYVRIVGTLWEDDGHYDNIIGNGGSNLEGVDHSDPESKLASSAKGCWHAGSINQGSNGRGWKEIHPVDFIAALDAPAQRKDAFQVITLCGAGEITHTIKLPSNSRPSPTAHISFKETIHTFTTFQDIETKTITPTAEGVEVKIKLKGRGLFGGDPKFFAGYHVFWTE
ncbi:MAG: hypothetical protein HY089_13085 [Ignavibacteriales bacterium]|nr:hypothetical protein [Ignavibacteriales bacterium]